MQIIRGKIPSAQKVVIYGPEGIGKSTFAAQFPSPLFIDTEGSTKHMDVARFPKPTSWSMLLEEVQQVRECPDLCKTLVIDTADWAERLCTIQVCSAAQKNGIEDFGYGKGYVYVSEEFGKLLNLLEEIVERDVHVVLTAHAMMRKFEQPDELGQYDRWEMKLSKKVAPIVKEWADMVLFANYKTFVVDVDGQGSQKGRNKVQGGQRVIYTSHHPCWDAKNRHGLPDELALDFAPIDACLGPQKETAPEAQPRPKEEQPTMVETGEPTPWDQHPDGTGKQETMEEAPMDSSQEADIQYDPRIPRELVDLMRANQVTESEIQEVVSLRRYYPRDTPIVNYDPDFILGGLVADWPKVLEMIQEVRTSPF